VFFWDHETESFWSQMTGECMVGPSTGKKLKWIATEMTTWANWKTTHPKTTVLAPVFDMRRYRAIARNYEHYRSGGKPMARFLGDKVVYPKTYNAMDLCTIINVPTQDPKKTGAPKTSAPRTVGRCFPHPALKEGKNIDGAYTVTKTGKKVVVTGKDGKVVPSLSGYWFSFFAFYPEGTVWEPKQAEESSSPR